MGLASCFLSRKDKSISMEKVGTVLSCDDWAGHSGDGCLYHSPHPPVLWKRGKALVVGREAVPLNRIRKLHLLQGQGPWRHRQGQAQRCSLAPGIKVNTALTPTETTATSKPRPCHFLCEAREHRGGCCLHCSPSRLCRHGAPGSGHVCVSAQLAGRMEGHNRRVSTRSDPPRGHTQLAFSSQEGFGYARALITGGPSSSRPQKPSTRISLF